MTVEEAGTLSVIHPNTFMMQTIWAVPACANPRADPFPPLMTLMTRRANSPTGGWEHPSTLVNSTIMTPTSTRRTLNRPRIP